MTSIHLFSNLYFNFLSAFKVTRMLNCSRALNKCIFFSIDRRVEEGSFKISIDAHPLQILTLNLLDMQASKLINTTVFQCFSIHG